jgi:hypothetical protein
VIWLALASYTLGLVLGVFASQALDFQLRRPGVKLSIVIAMLGTLITIFLIHTNSTMPQWLLLTLWLGIGLLAGLGSRDARVPIH